MAGIGINCQALPEILIRCPAGTTDEKRGAPGGDRSALRWLVSAAPRRPQRHLCAIVPLAIAPIRSGAS